MFRTKGCWTFFMIWHSLIAYLRWLFLTSYCLLKTFMAYSLDGSDFKATL